MYDFVLFINSNTDGEVAKKVYKTAPVTRITAYNAKDYHTFAKDLKSKLWIDPCFDGFPTKPVNEDDDKKNKWFDYFSDVEGFEYFLSTNLPKTAKIKELEPFVFSILDDCLSYKPDILTIPQLPHLATTTNNKINKILSKIYLKWSIERKFEGESILPVVFNNQNSTCSGAIRSSKLKTIQSLYNEAKADGVWIVDSSLQDQAGTGNFEKKRFPSLIDMHNKVKQTIKPKIHFAGPYWGIQLILWAREIISSPAFSIGSSYQYYISGGQPRTPSPRMAIPPLLRWARSSSDLKKWLRSSKSKIKIEVTKKQFEDLTKTYDHLYVSKKHKEQIAHFHHDWFKKYLNLPSAARALALYQDLSSAYVLGSQLDDILSEKGSSRKPEVVAKQLMLNCL